MANALMKSMANPLRSLAVAAACCALFAYGRAMAGDFAVNPIRLELGASARSGVIGVRNESKDKLSFQLQAMEWTQDGTGKDQYADTQDLIFFPKIMSVEPGEEGLIRVGSRNALVPAEKTYRLFIEELPGVAKTPEGGSAQINVLIRFGAPIFVTPIKPMDTLEISNVELVKGILTILAKNTGNRHQIVQGIQLKGADARGNEVYALTFADRYLLAGTTKSYTTSIAADQCAKIVGLVVEFKTDKLTVKRQLDVIRAMCP